jgi:uncharacterized protein (UPF0333 family)
MDQKGQISIEFVLIIALIFVIVLAVGSYVGEQNELNSVSVAARTGATDAVTNLVITNNISPLRIEDIRMNGSGKNLILFINISGPISTSSNQTIVNNTLNSIASVGYTRINSGNIFTDYINTTRHTYNVVLV